MMDKQLAVSDEQLAKTCKHLTSRVIFSTDDVSVSMCTWGCKASLVSVVGEDGITVTIPAAELLQFRREREQLRQGYEAAQIYAESLPRDVRVRFFVGGHDIIESLIEYNKKTIETVKELYAAALAQPPSDGKGAK